MATCGASRVDARISRPSHASLFNSRSRRRSRVAQEGCPCCARGVVAHSDKGHSATSTIDVITSADEGDWSPPEPIADELKSSDGETSDRSTLWGSLVAVCGLLALIAGGVVFKDQLAAFLTYFADIIDDMGPAGYVLFFFVYAGLEVLAVPAIPLTMASGAIFGILPGSILVSLSGTAAAAVSFLIARYVARDKFSAWAQKSKQFRAVNTVIEKDGFKVVALLRLSPLLPLAASNYLYGLTNVSLPAFFFGSWVGMFPGTVAYVSAGHVGKAALGGGESLSLGWWQIAAAFAVTGAAIAYIGSLATAALKEEEARADANVAADREQG
eukprot:jgi/Ulvmu1/9022/UM005_0113.1